MGLGSDARRDHRCARAGPGVRARPDVAEPGRQGRPVVSAARRRLVTALLGLMFVALVAVVSVPRAGGAVVGGPGGSGIDTSLPEEDSAVTVNGRGDFAAVSLRVNQT